MKITFWQLFAKLPKHFWCVINFCWPDSGNCQLGEDDHQLRLGLETNSCMCSAYRWSYWKQGRRGDPNNRRVIKKWCLIYCLSNIGLEQIEKPYLDPKWYQILTFETWYWKVVKNKKKTESWKPRKSKSKALLFFFALGFVPLILVDDGPPLLPLMVL